MTLPTPNILALALAGLALGACTARESARTSPLAPRYASLDAAFDGGRPAAVPPARAATPVAVLPDWIGRPLRLRERDEPDAFEQVVTLPPAPRGATRENLVLLRMSRTASAALGPAVDGMMLGGRPTEAGIRAELAAAFPDTPMQVVTRSAANAYGPYGLAIGRAPSGARCLYAWQWIADAPVLDPADRAAGPLSLRVRLCRDDMTLEAMAAAVNRLTLVPRYGGTPVADTRPAQPASATRRRGHAHAAAARPRQRTRDAEHDAAPARTAAVEAPAAAQSGAGRRYLGVAEAPLLRPEAARDASYGAATARGSAAGPAPAPQTATLSADLPPEALRGPPPRPPGRP
ncbi:cellulose biosynthesis protein BcsN [Methylobacterium sp. NEAU 140]|uniref:cellulose biosynthesis protein BcsN n=1 Tax=Methylobacterium sp. NEAU 140 TaxID=3064945 RepID=UPI00273567D6|nr:cellulose biosynthesis protein BcsN [Methylobacterium sp. NEAU 140]MDP4023020.1 cellulose biosynthesis protein BcsN [Methylobacterium sp. NEAU 140]